MLFADGEKGNQLGKWTVITIKGVVIKGITIIKGMTNIKGGGGKQPRNLADIAQRRW